LGELQKKKKVDHLSDDEWWGKERERKKKEEEEEETDSNLSAQKSAVQLSFLHGEIVVPPTLPDRLLNAEKRTHGGFKLIFLGTKEK